jgi:hypothetical protein
MTTICALFCALSLSPVQAVPARIFINELHYDNAGMDEHEAVELAGTAGSFVDGWSLALYNGRDGSVYQSLDLVGRFPDLMNGFGFLSFAMPGMQNGSPDGIALVQPDLQVAEFISYEGVINALSGPAAGLSSLDIGLTESAATVAGQSLFLTGSGYQSSDFSWASGDASFGAPNQHQYFVSSPDEVAAVPLPGAFGLMIIPLLMLGRLSQDRTCLRKRPV